MSAFCAGKRVFLTGHTGFKGSWLALWLQQFGARVTGYALGPPPATPSLVEIACVGAGMESMIGDVAHYDHLVSSVHSSAPEIVIHMDANPVETYCTNVMGTVHLLHAVRQVNSVRAVVNITSDKCYENRKWTWGYRENDRLGGRDPYSNSKAFAELVSSGFRDAFFQPASHLGHAVALATARAGNVIGGAERLFVDGLAFADVWNFGQAEVGARSVTWIADGLISMWSPEARWTVTNAQQPHEDHYLRLDCAKAGLKLDWHPRWDLSTALTRIVLWHKAWLASDDMAARTLVDIIDFTGGRGDRGDSI